MAPRSGGPGNPPERYFRFGDVEVDTVGHTLTRAGVPQQIEPKAFAVLLALLEHPGELVSRDELLDSVWGHRHVTPGVLTRAIAQLRAVLEDDHHHPRYIQTRHALGYAFIGELEPPSGDRRRHEGPQWAGSGPGPPSHGPDGEVPSHGPAGAGEAVALEGRGAPLAPEEAAPSRLSAWALPVAVGVLLAGLLLWAGQRDAALGPAEASVAVLPFTSLGSDRDQDFFAEGLAVEMHDALAGVEGLRVAARIPASAAAKLDTDVRTLGRTLGVATVLDASVRRDGDRVRINARLSDCNTGFTLWSRSFDRQVGDVFDTQAEIAALVVESLLGALPQPHEEALARRLAPTRNASAFDAYLRGMQQLRLAASDSEALDSAIQWFDRALEEDSGFFRAQAGICRSELARFDAMQDARAFRNAQTACALAREMAPGSSEVDLALGDLHRLSGDAGQAMAFYAKARRDPARAPEALVGMAQLHAARGEHERAAAYFHEAIEISPGNASIHGFLGLEQYRAGNLDGAITAFRRAVELEPGSAELWSSLGGVYLAAGLNREAALAFERSLAIRPTAAVLSNYAEIKQQHGDYAAAVTLLRRALELDSGNPVFWGNLGDALLGDPVTAGQAPDAHAKAARLAGEYLEINPDDATMAAATGWYLVNSGQRERALEMVERAGRLGAGRAEVGVMNAKTMAALGDNAAALHWIGVARRSGVPESRIRADPGLRRVLEDQLAEGPARDGTEPVHPGREGTTEQADEQEKQTGQPHP